MINLIKGAQHPKPAIERLTELYVLIRDEYSGVFTKKDLSTIFYTIANRIDETIAEEKQVALDNNGL